MGCLVRRLSFALFAGLVLIATSFKAGAQEHASMDVRQGNTGGDQDARNDSERQQLPYAGESYDDLQGKYEDRLKDPEWRVGIDLKEPRRIVITHPDGTAEEYWYILYRAINDNYRRVSRKTASGYKPSPDDAGRDPQMVLVESKELDEYEGLPVQTSIDLVVETLHYDVHADPKRAAAEGADDLSALLEDEAKRDIGSGLSDAVDADKADKLVQSRYDYVRHTYTDIADSFVLQQIAEKEELWEWRNGRREYILWPSSGFKYELAPAHELENDWLDGPRCLPIEREEIDARGDRHVRTLHPVIFDDLSWAGFYEDGAALPEGAEQVKVGHEMYGKLTRRRYQAYDVVDRFGRILNNNEPGYLAAKRAGGQIVRAASEEDSAGNPIYDVEGNLESLIDQTARRPAYRHYKEGDRVLMGWDTGVPMEGRPNQNHTINGLIVNENDQDVLSSYVETRRGYTFNNPNADEEIGLSAVRAASEDRYAESEEITSSAEYFDQFSWFPDGRFIPVKLIDHLGRPVQRGGPLTYKVGDIVSEAEYRIWAQRYSKDVVGMYDGSPWDRPLTIDDFMVGLPKIKMGRALDISRAQPEVLRRGTADQIVDGEVVRMRVSDYETGRLYDPKKVAPEIFLRDPDGTFTTFREAPVPSGAALAYPGEEYVYAPLGTAEIGANPVPRFDRFGVWEDYVDPVTGKKIPLRDGNGELVRDEYDQIQYVKDYEYEYLYVYEFEPLVEEDNSFKVPYGGDLSQLKKVEGGVEVIKKNGNIVGLALPRIVLEETYVDALTGEEQTRTIVKGLAFGNNTPNQGAGERLEAASTFLAEGEKIETVEMSQFLYDHLLATYASGSSREGLAKSDDYQAVDQSDLADSELEEVTKTYDRWTLPPPMMYDNVPFVDVVDTESGALFIVDPSYDITTIQSGGTIRVFDSEGSGDYDGTHTIRGFDYVRNGIRSNASFDGSASGHLSVTTPAGEPHVQTRMQAVLGPDGKAGHVSYISERWGAFVFKTTDRAWDYMNVYVRGLRSPYTRRGRSAENYSLPSPQNPDISIDKVRFNTSWYRQDWVYTARYERLGDEFENFRDSIRPLREYWFLRSEDKQSDPSKIDID